MASDQGDDQGARGEGTSGLVLDGARHADRRRPMYLTIAWSVSAAFHLSLLIAFAWITWWQARPSVEAGAEVPVEVLAADAGPNLAIDPGRTLAIRDEGFAPNVPDLMVQQPAEAIGSLSSGGGSGEKDPVIGPELESGGPAGAAGGDWSVLAGGGGEGRGGGASFFGLQAVGRKFVFVVDRSASMATGRLDAAKAELTRSISALDRESQFFVFMYNESYVAMPEQKLVHASEQNKRKLFKWMQTIAGEDGTDPRGAMLAALVMKPDAIYLLSDGEFDEQACDTIRSHNPGAKIQIHTIAFHSDGGAPQLRRIAEENRGKYRFVPPLPGMPGAAGP